MACKEVSSKPRMRNLLPGWAKAFIYTHDSQPASGPASLMLSVLPSFLIKEGVENIFMCFFPSMDSSVTSLSAAAYRKRRGRKLTCHVQIEDVTSQMLQITNWRGEKMLRSNAQACCPL